MEKKPFESISEHIEAETEWAKLLLKRFFNQTLEADDEEPSGIGSSMEEAIAFIYGEGLKHPLDEKIKEMRKLLDYRLKLTGNRLPWNRFCKLLNLEGLQKEFMTLLFLKEVNPFVDRVFKIAMDDLSDTPPDVSFFVRLIARKSSEVTKIRKLLRINSPLRAYRILLLGNPSSPLEPESEKSILNRSVKLSNRAVSFCLNEEEIDESISQFCTVENSNTVFDEIFLKDDVMEEIKKIVKIGRPLRMYLYGMHGVGKTTVARAVANSLNKKLLIAKLMEDKINQEVLRTILREGILTDALIYFDITSLEGAKKDDITSIFPEELIKNFKNGIIIGALSKYHNVHNFPEVYLPLPDAKMRIKIWDNFLKNFDLDEGISTKELASRFNLSTGAIKVASEKCYELALRRNPEKPQIRKSDLMLVATELISGKITGLAQRIIPGYEWNDLVLPEKPMQQIKEFVSFAKYKDKIFNEWGFSEKVVYGRGVSALFYGPPGTGKTMVSMLVAKELGLELYRVDLSQIINKYVGETEKNIARLFDEVEANGGILLFDEADALFTKRTEVQSSVDKYSNLEVNFLLQRMEDFNGITILTTNFEKAIDEAFKRRIKFKIYFPFPDEESRMLLWQSMIPEYAPIEDDIDWERLAEFELSGGHIKNAVILAALWAASEDRPITHHDLELAAVRKSQEIGLAVRSELIKDEE